MPIAKIASSPALSARSTSTYSLRRFASPVSASCSAWCSFSFACSSRDCSASLRSVMSSNIVIE